MPGVRLNRQHRAQGALQSPGTVICALSTNDDGKARAVVRVVSPLESGHEIQAAIISRSGGMADAADSKDKPRSLKRSLPKQKKLKSSATRSTEVEAPRAPNDAAATSLPHQFDPVAKAIADGQYDVARALLSEMKRIAEATAGNVVELAARRRRVKQT